MNIQLSMQSSKLKFEFTGPNQIFEFYFYIVLNKNIEKCTGPNKDYLFWPGGTVFIVRTIDVNKNM
jgi:hypothetical protein